MCQAETIQTPQRYETLDINKFLIIMQIIDFDALIFLCTRNSLIYKVNVDSHIFHGSLNPKFTFLLWL